MSMDHGPIRVVIADDHNLFRDGLRSIIDGQPDLTVVGEGSDGNEAAAVVERERADVVLMDVSMPGADGLTGLVAVRAARPQCAVVMLTTFNVDDSIEQALAAGASGYLLKTASAEQMLSAIRAAHRGERVFSRAIQDRLVEAYLDRKKRDAPPPAELGLLTEREFQVFTELARGKSNAEIAKALFLSEGTVKTYVTRLLTKLGLRDRVQAVIYALQHGLLAEAGERPPLRPDRAGRAE